MSKCLFPVARKSIAFSSGQRLRPTILPSSSLHITRHCLSTTSAVPPSGTDASKKPRARSRKRRAPPVSGLNLSKTKNSVAEGSFLLTDEGKNPEVFTAAQALNESTVRNQYSDILIQLQAQNQGANVSLFYKQNGGVVATRGQGAYIYQDPQFSRTGNIHENKLRDISYFAIINALDLQTISSRQ